MLQLDFWVTIISCSRYFSFLLALCFILSFFFLISYVMSPCYRQCSCISSACLIAILNEFDTTFLLGTVFFRTALPWCSGGYHMERVGIPLQDAVGINCKKGSTTENQGSGVKYIF